MATLRVSLSDRLKIAAAAQAAESGFPSIDDYIASLIEADKALPIDEALETELLRGLDSGPSAAVTAGFWDQLKSRARSRQAPPDKAAS